MSTPPIQPEGAKGLIASGAARSERTFDEADFKKRLIDEYKILQDKIDKIGGFRFTIKGWSVTAVIAASAAGSAANRLLTVVMISVGLGLMLCFFFWFELEQVRLSRLFGDRARRLENSFRLFDRGEGKTTSARIPVPYTAHEIVLAISQPELLRGRASRESRRGSKLSRRWVDWWRVVGQAHIFFYLVLICLTFLPLLPRYDAIRMHWKQWTEKMSSSWSSTAPPPCGATEVQK